MNFDSRCPRRIQRLALPERAALLGSSLAEAERDFDIFAAGDGLINLTYADTHRFPCPDWVVDDFVAAARGGGDTYTPSRGDLGVRRQLAPALTQFLGVPIDPDTELALTPGTQGGLFCGLAAVADDDETVLVVDPDYLTNERLLRFLGANVLHVRLEFTGRRLTLDLDEVERGLTLGGRVLVLSHPNNPTGAVFDHATVRGLAQLLVEHDAFVLVDELYARLVYDGTPFYHLIAEEGMKERCITLLGPSKTESMSGYRMGVVIAPAQIIDRIEAVQSITAIRAPAYAQHTLRRWLSDDHEFLHSRIAAYQELRDIAVRRLTTIDSVRLVPAQGTAYLFPNVSALDRSDREIALALRERARAVVNPGFQFGPSGAGSFRICFAQDEAVWPEALTLMVGVLQELEATPKSNV